MILDIKVMENKKENPASKFDFTFKLPLGLELEEEESILGKHLSEWADRVGDYKDREQKEFMPELPGLDSSLEIESWIGESKEDVWSEIDGVPGRFLNLRRVAGCDASNKSEDTSGITVNVVYDKWVGR